MVTKASQQSQYTGYSVLTQASSTTSALKPVIYLLNQATNGSNAINMNISVSEAGTVYFAAMSLATQKKDVTQALIYGNNISTGISYGNATAALVNSGNVNIEAAFTVSGLQASSTYLIGAYVNSSVGLSDIMFQTI